MIGKVLTSFVLIFSTVGCLQAKDAEGLGLVDRQPADAMAAGQIGREGRLGRVDLPRFPSISPDGSQVVFSWRGDLWKVAASGGHAERLTTHPADDRHSSWSWDGGRIAFDSDRTGWRNIFIMNADGTDVRQVTDIDRDCVLTGFDVAADGSEAVTLAAYLEGDNYRAPRPYKCSTAGGDIVRLHDAFGTWPKVSPDGTRLVFTRGGSRWSRRGYRGPDSREVWLYHQVEGSFTQMTHWEGNDGRTCWAGPDSLLFISDRELNCCNIYRMDAGKGDANCRRLTSFTEDDVQELDVSADGSTAVFMVWDKLYTLDLNNADAEPVPLTITANQDELDNIEIHAIDKDASEAVLSPDGKVMALVAYGEVYVRNLEEKSPTRRVTRSHARERHIAFSPDGLKLYFVSDRSGTNSIYTATVALTREEVKEEFEKATKPPEDEEEKPEEQEAPAEGDEPSGDTPKQEEGSGWPTSFGGGGGDDRGRSPEHISSSPPCPKDMGHPPDDTEDDDEPQAGKDAEGEEDGDDEKKDDDDNDEDEDLPKELRPKRWRDALTFNIEPVVQSDHNDRNPRPSPDGKSLAFHRDLGDLMILDLENNETRGLVKGWDTGLDWRWSPDSRHVAYQQNDLNFNSDIWVVPADGSKPAVNVSRHPDDDSDPRFSADGKILSFISERVNEEYDLWMVYLDKDLEVLPPAELDKYYKDAVKAAKKRKPLKVKKPQEEEEQDKQETAQSTEADTDGQDEQDESDKQSSGTDGKEEEPENGDKDKQAKEDGQEEESPKELDLEDAYLRLRRVTKLSGNEGNNEITPGGDRYIFTATLGKRGLYSVKWDGEDRQRLCDSVSVQHVSLTGDKIVLVHKGKAGTIDPTGDKIEYVDISDKMRIDLREQASQKFLEMARIVGENFYHPTLKGLDWAALTRKYHALAQQTRTADEFNHVGMRLFGELNGSHLGVRSDGFDSPNARPQGRLGTVHRRVEQGYEVVEVIPESSAAKGPMALKAGDVITALDLQPFTPTDTVESRLAGWVDKEIIVTVERTMDDGQVKTLNVLITPIGVRDLNRLKYKAWRRHNAELVTDWSDGRIGYIHIEGMGQASLDVFERDLYAAVADKDGLIIDVRNNGGGWTADRLLASIMVRPHAYTIPRGADPADVGHYPQGRLFIQRYTLPINMLCNEKSFSNAEIVSHAFKTLRRGTLVGQQTYGAVISTGGTRLIDGTWVRLPFRGWFLPDGTDMENHGALPDIIVPQTPQAESRNDDQQLRAAVDDLLKRLE